MLVEDHLPVPVELLAHLDHGPGQGCHLVNIEWQGRAGRDKGGQMHIRIQSCCDISDDPVKGIARQALARHALADIGERGERRGMADFEGRTRLGAEPFPGRFRESRFSKGEPLIFNLVQGRDHFLLATTNQHA